MPIEKPIYRCLCGEEFDDPRVFHLGNDDIERVCPSCSGIDFKEVDYGGENEATIDTVVGVGDEKQKDKNP